MAAMSELAPASAHILWSHVLGACALLLMAAWAVWMLEWAWRKPRRLELALRAQGLRGTAYRFPYGDLKASARLLAEARSKRIAPSSHDIVPRVAPLLHLTMKKYGKMSFTWDGPVPRVTVMDLEMVKEVLAHKSSAVRKPNTNPLSEFFLRGLATQEGNEWVKRRRILNPAFSVEKLKRMLPAFFDCCSDMVDRWEGAMVAEGWCELDVWPEFKCLSGNVISRATFSCSNREGRRIHQLQAEQAELLAHAAQNLHIPGYKFLPTGTMRRIKAIGKEIRSIIGDIIKKREQDALAGRANRDDLLDLMMDSSSINLQEDGSSDKNGAAGMTAEDVMEECKMFYFAGEETTSILLTWTMVVLSMHPRWQERARQEVVQLFGEVNGGCKRPDFDGLGRLKIVTMILNEVLRLYPPALFLQRQTHSAVELGGIVYPPGVVLSLAVVFIHRDPTLWGADAGEFNPDRFARGVSKACGDRSAAFFPFGGGPRICIGQNIALLEAKMALCMILLRFSFELSPSYVHAPDVLLFLQPQHGAQLRLSRI